MGGEGSGRKPDVTNQVLRNAKEQLTPILSNGNEPMYLPNYSGIKDFARKDKINNISGQDGHLVHCSPLMMNFIQPHEGTNPVIPTGTWDAKIREPSNIFIESHSHQDKFKLLYKGYDGGNDGIGYAYSSDGLTWTKYGSGPVISGAYEDAYIVYKDSTYYVYLENNSNNKIKLFTSTDFINWTDRGDVLDLGTGWENFLVGSPVVIIEDNIFKMIYEGIGTGTNGSFGYATSTDGLNWTKYASNPVLADSAIPWIADSIVPDNMIKIDGLYYMLYHGTTKYPIASSTARPSICFSSDLINWVEYKDEWIDIGGQDGSASDPHWFFDGNKWVIMYINGDSSGIKRGYPGNRNFFHLTNTDTLELEKQLKIRQNASHLHFEEVDTGKEWHQEVTGSVFKIVETGVADRLTVDNTTGLVGVPSLTASKPVFTDSNKKLSSSGTVPIANGGTGATTYGTNKGFIYYDGSVSPAVLKASDQFYTDTNFVTFSKSIVVGETITSPAIEDAIYSGGWMTIGDPYAMYSGECILIDAGGNYTSINTSDLQINGTSGFTGTGAYTNFTIQNGIITSAS